MKAIVLVGCACVALLLVIPSGRHHLRALFDDDDGGTGPGTTDGKVLFSDDSEAEDPQPIWGSVDCDFDDTPPAVSGPIQFDSDGDPHPRGDGDSQGDDAYREVRINDGDNYFGERCELGLNDSDDGPTAVYTDGEHLITYASFRLPPTFPIDTTDWQGVLQMKQAQPADNAGGTPVLSLGAYDGKWILFHSGPGYTKVDQELWSAPAQSGVWARFAFDVTYSVDPAIGQVTVHADLDGDGTFDEQGETSPTFHTNTLKVETEGTSGDGYDAGDTLPSHLRVGLYHNPVIPCPSGCHLDIDNVQIMRP
jgi:hypothetical protein